MLKILKLAIPISLSNIIGVISVLVNTKILGDVSSYNLYILTLFMPLNFWVISLFESFRVPATSVSAHAYSRGRLDLIGSQIGCLLLMTMIGIIIPLIIVMFSQDAVSYVLSIHSASDFIQFKLFTCYMLPASFILSAFFIVCSVFNGIGRHKFAMTVTFLGVFLSTFLNYFLSRHTHLSILSMPVAMLITYSLLLSGIVFILLKMKIFTVAAFKNSLSINNFKMLKRLAFPVLVSYLIITCAVLFFTHLLSPYGHNVISGFGIAYRIQTLIFLPAISIGIAIGILINKNLEKQENKSFLFDGILICALLYCIISLSIYYRADYLVSLITNDHDVIVAASHYLKTVCISYIGFSISLCFCIALDQIGYGIQSAIFTASIFIIEITMALILFRYWHSEDALYWSIVTGNTLSCLVSLFFMGINNVIIFKPKFITNQVTGVG